MLYLFHTIQFVIVLNDGDDITLGFRHATAQVAINRILSMVVTDVLDSYARGASTGAGLGSRMTIDSDTIRSSIRARSTRTMIRLRD